MGNVVHTHIGTFEYVIRIQAVIGYEKLIIDYESVSRLTPLVNIDLLVRLRTRNEIGRFPRDSRTARDSCCAIPAE